MSLGISVIGEKSVVSLPLVEGINVGNSTRERFNSKSMYNISSVNHKVDQEHEEEAGVLDDSSHGPGLREPSARHSRKSLGGAGCLPPQSV